LDKKSEKSNVNIKKDFFMRDICYMGNFQKGYVDSLLQVKHMKQMKIFDFE